MIKTRLMLASTALAFSLALGAPAWAQDIDFGDNTSNWANDGQCDDPRFTGPGTAGFLSPVDEMRDAADCEAAFEAGEVSLATQAPEPDAPPLAPAPPETEPEQAAPEMSNDADIDFGDDSGAFANDGECDDPRFGGILDSHELADASDCRTAYDAGDVTFSDTESVPPATVSAGGIDFGDDSGNWSNDGECDDPRFGGTLSNHEFADATDCRTAYEAGTVTYSGDSNGGGTTTGDIDFGDDSGTFANDGECDDPRFGGTLTSHELADATDCQSAYEAGDVTFTGSTDSGGMVDADIDFGDDSGVWANDGECDDPRFGGTLDSHEFADATDCRTAYDAGDVTFDGEQQTGSPLVIDGIEFGDDAGVYAMDDECDDPRFTGSGMGAALDDHLMADASDCSAAYQAGTVTLTDTTGGMTSEDFRINFGDDSGAAAFDGVCDDPRFQGRGGALELLDANMLADATDCRAAYDAGTVTYNP